MTETMEEISNSVPNEALIKAEAPKLVSLLKEMKNGLDALRVKVDILVEKVRQGGYPTSEGMSYLEAKHLLLLSYCQSLVYYLLRKAKGLSVDGHPVIRNLIEIRLFLEKIRPIDKKLEYQTHKLIQTASAAPEKSTHTSATENEAAAPEVEDPLRYRPNPDMLIRKSAHSGEDTGAVYRPPKFAPTTMDDDKMSKMEKVALRKEKHKLRQAGRSEYVKDLINDFEGRPEEVRDIVGSESREFSMFREKMEERARQEEEMFTRAPLSKLDKKKMKHLRKSRNGLLSLTDGFHDEIGTFGIEENDGPKERGSKSSGMGGRKSNKRKRRH
ncbi:hypothetical protein QJS10_CPA05g01470 [Acorus calamus]|uniref:Neuroguidin n=1 Tax=Acorus calamus TaxID=4465 RepID=A0AAV9EY59_ACOCL|nr:hypothetical protein QJS10_CPA05g01470 [Acorus calamus]